MYLGPCRESDSNLLTTCLFPCSTCPADEAAAIFNTVFSNMTGIFLSPILILLYLGIDGDIDIPGTFTKLSIRVLLPLAVGQIIRQTMPPVVRIVKKNKYWFSKSSEYLLIYIIYTIFCTTFSGDSMSSLGNLFLMILYQFVLLCMVKVLSWYLLRLQFSDQPQICITGLFGCTHKTIAIGVPLINAIYEGNPNVGLYTLPLLVWYPMQLIIGSAAAPRLNAFVESEKKRLGIVDEISERVIAPAKATESKEFVVDEEQPALLASGSEPASEGVELTIDDVKKD
jgi:sodium/bile acid cotransporter 7